MYEREFRTQTFKSVLSQPYRDSCTVCGIPKDRKKALLHSLPYHLTRCLYVWTYLLETCHYINFQAVTKIAVILVMWLVLICLCIYFIYALKYTHQLRSDSNIDDRTVAFVVSCLFWVNIDFLWGSMYLITTPWNINNDFCCMGRQSEGSIMFRTYNHAECGLSPFLYTLTSVAVWCWKDWIIFSLQDFQPIKLGEYRCMVLCICPYGSHSAN